MVLGARGRSCPRGHTMRIVMGCASCCGCSRVAGALLLALALLLCSLHGGRGQELGGSGTGFSLHPPSFNLAEGARITATATCGEEESRAGGTQPRVDLYCKLVGGPVTSSTQGHTIQGQSCDFCDSSDPNKAHPASNAIDGTERWWQSPPLSLGLKYNEVNVTIDLGQVFHVAYVLIKFANSPRPDLWVLERSVDFGSSFTPWQYFANSKHDCLHHFGKDAKQPITRDDDVICTTEYSRIVPLENGEVVVRLVSGRPGAKHFTDSPILRDFTKATNIRLRFLRTNTLLGHLISKAENDQTVTRRYYYSIKDISIGGRCVCHGHANVCNVRSFGNQNLYQCTCQHNTCGEICDRCCPGYNQKPWRPASIDAANQCEPCNCHGHASDCYYDSDVDNRQASLDIYGQYSGGGVCINCQHNTAGINCEKCAVGYYRPYGVPKEAPHGCIPCSCNLEHSNGCEEESGRCYCKPNFSGNSCERCAEGYYGYPVCLRIPFYPVPTTSWIPVKPTAGNIKGCSCTGAGALSQNCDTLTGQCPCRVGYRGTACDKCSPGYFHYPFCQGCDCNPGGVLPGVCSPTGRCLCKLRVEGARCDQCRPGYHSFPSCKECDCDMNGATDPSCGLNGECLCRPNFSGHTCNECAPNFYNYPICEACQCSPQGSYQSTCDPITGQCECRQGVTGQRCDRCSTGLDNYPNCQDVNGECDPAGTLSSQAGFCHCLSKVEGITCNHCKPLFWNLDEDNPQGCIGCACDVDGTISGIGECHQTEGDCHCKPNTCSTSCGTCEEGYFYLDGKNYFGCKGCQCDVGGSVSHRCDESTGNCICRSNIEGQNCNQPKENYYFPDLHQMKFEIEDGTTVNGRAVRFGYDPQVFPGFSWRGYAQMSSIQNEVRVPVHVGKSNLNLFRIILRYINPGVNSITGRITAQRSRSSKGSLDVKDIVFPPSMEPTFLTVPGKSFAEPFSLVPGNWIITISVEGVLLDYLVLLPSDYYEASILQLRVTDPCDYNGPIGANCLVFQHLPMEKFTCLHGTEMEYFKQDGENRPIIVRQPGHGHPLMAAISGRQVELHFSMKVARAGLYALIFEYANEDAQQYFLNVMIGNDPSTSGRVNVYSCKYSFLCRSIVVDSMNRIAKFEIPSEAEIYVTTQSVNFLLHTVCMVPVEEFSVEYAEPKVRCIAAYGRTPDQSPSCIQSSVYENPPLSILLDPVKDSRYPGGQKDIKQEPVHEAGNGVLLTSQQNQITFGRRIPNTGRYVFIVHYYQTQNPAFHVSVLVNGGTQWSGNLNVSYCPHTFGCRGLVIAGNRISLDVTNLDLSVTVKTPPDKPLLLESVLLVPADNFTHDILQEKPLDKSFDFITICGENSFYIDPFSSPDFCKDSARSLVAYYNDGALPCRCHAEGSINPVCNPFGGQCSCRPNTIGRTCSHCATGYYGFPHCRPCTCGRRLCDEITGRCICPPQTVKPTCEVCVQHTFSYHPLLGCEGCNCSTTGVIQPFQPECDSISGQCRCKSRISGRQCDRCAPGYFRFPDCIPCDCNSYGTEPQICDHLTGVCLCKENTEGSRCDVCRSGSFYFDPSNAKGCIRCFCFGATDICHSSNKQWKKFVDMRSWILETSDQTRVDVTFNPGSNSVVADVQELPLSVHSLHWAAPASFLGERISTYGGYLTYQLKSFGLPSEGMVLLDKRPDVLLTGRQMTVVYVDPNNPLPDRQYYGRVQLVESNFRHASSNNLVSREELMMILSRLESLHIRALYFSETQRLTLGEVGLEDVTISGSGRVALNVEICACPPEYTGDSCQECAPGHYRENKGLYLGRCVPCRCNGHSTRCHDGSGICINCQHNTEGDHCERCKESYSGNATQGSCTLCPCPLPVASNSFATGCSGSGRNLRCFCKPGYTGYNCGECAYGYYGNPLRLGGRCQPCNCGNNGQVMSCDPLTGECLDETPKDNGSDDLCDSCVDTLLMDLMTINDELNLIKARLQSINATSRALEQIRALEARIREVKQQYDNYNSKLTNQRLKVNNLDTETNALKGQIAGLLEKAEINSKKYESIMMNADDTFRNASRMLLTIDLLMKNINILIKNVGNAQGGVSPPQEVSKNMAEAQRMLNEMRKRSFNAQKKEAELEKEEAKSLLNRVRNQFQKHLDQHKDLIREITKSIKDYEAKLNDLRDALGEASGQTKQANDLNKQNAMTLEDIKKRVEELKRQQKEAAKHLKAAETSLGQTGTLVNLLQRSKEEYEKLAAQMDGAKQELTGKVNNLSKAASKEPLVILAEKHAQSLQDLANQLLEIKKNTSDQELVRCAVDAANAYQDIINAIKAAEDASKKAKTAADSALTKVQSEDLPGKAKKSLTDSEALLDEAKKTQKSLADVNPQLEDIKDRLTEATDKKNRLSGDLSAVKNSINGIKGDDIENMINNAKGLVATANTITNNVQAELQPIKEDVENLKGTVGTAQNANFNEALKEASNSVLKLSGSLPDVFEAMNRINSLVPLGNISESVSRIRELIQQARDAANKVVVPMRFDGNSGVEVRPPSNLDDLKAYTSLSFFLQRPQSRGDRKKRQLSANMFVMYLGSKDTSKDYIGIGVEDGQLMCIYNLGGNVAEVSVDQYISSNKADEAILDRVTLERIYQYVTLNYTKSYTSSNPDPTKTYTTNTLGNTLLNLNAEDVVFYVGGYPDDFTPPPRLNYPKYQGCIELDDMNQNAISLYNFRRTFNIDTVRVEPCKRYKEESERSFFEGIGYATISYNVPNIRYLRFEQTIQTTSDVGLLFFAVKEESYISVEIEDGILVLKYKINSNPEQQKKNVAFKRINSGTEILIEVLVAPNDKLIRIRQDREVLNASNVDAFTFGTYYLGGAPTELREKFNINTPPFRGCVKNVKTPVSAASFKETYGVSRRCYSEWSTIRSAMFSNGGTLGLKPDGFSFPGDFQASFGFQTPQVDAMLLNHKTQSDELHVSLEDGTVTVTTTNSNINLRSRDKYSDGKLHYVSVIRNNNEYQLLVDDNEETENTESSRRPGYSPTDIYIGGNGFKGCMTNVFIRRALQYPTVQNLFDNTEKNKVSLGMCTPEEAPLPLILREHRQSLNLRLNDIDLSGLDIRNNLLNAQTHLKNSQGCASHSNFTSNLRSYRFGDSPASHLVYDLSKQSFKERSYFSLDVQTEQSSGLIFLMTNKEESSYLALHISKGRFVFSLGTKDNKLKIRSQDKYNDGKWHTVAFSWDGTNGRLVIGGLKARKGSLPKHMSLENMSLLYLGGVPSLKVQGMPKKSFNGCLKNVKLNEAMLDRPSRIVGVTPCHHGTYETGVYFAQDSGHVAVDNALNLGHEFEISFDIRPQGHESVLLHTREGKENRLSLYIDNGKVILSIANNEGNYQASVTPVPLLCDGKWHTITVSQKANSVQLNVDNQSKNTAGPNSALRSSKDATLYIGGIPDALETQWLPVKRSFVGCMKNLKVNKKDVNFSKITDINGAISLSRCPAA
ncbi:laminin subunit alpha-3 isoform X2 [Hyla sarda]|uniref:laminin subunit alpha-3 isoform X2 n=1 Tax=Hyla sarda TaxID=327740 RepID=UPI0024C3C682|nr:laminin subunit alpha-3 isoform X2 [Hyla sarda]